MLRSSNLLRALVPLAVSVAGCFHFDGLSPDGGADLSQAGGGATDGAGRIGDGGNQVGDGGGLVGDDGGAQPGTCPRPWLLELVGSASGGGTDHAQVVHYSVAGGKLTRCDIPTFDVGGTLPAWPNALGFIPGAEVIAVGDEVNTYLIDATTGALRGTYKESELQGQNLPRDIFALDDGGNPRIAILYANPFATELSDWADHIEVIDDHAKKVASWMFGMAQSPLHSIQDDVVAMTASPYKASQMLYRCFGDSDAEAITIDAPFDGKPRLPDKPGLWMALPGGVARQIYSPGVPQGKVTTRSWAWTMDAGVNGGSAKIYRANDDGKGPSLVGPLDCPAHCPQPTYFQHAVPDPTDANAVFAMCDDKQDKAMVVRIAMGGACDVVDQSQSYVLEHPRFQRLAIAP